jgi:hypothetical protein
MSISIEQFNSLLDYETASWAFWSKGFNKNDCLESIQNNIEGFLRKHIPEFKDNVVLLGLNRSSNKRRNSGKSKVDYPHCANFHGKGHAGDGFLSNTISKLDALHGAFMTDLSIDFESDSKKIKIKSIEHLQCQLDILGSRSVHIVCFGQKVFSTFQILTNEQPIILQSSDNVSSLAINFHERTFHCYKVIHYSYAVRYNHQNRFIKQMEAVNNTIKQSAV